MHIALIIRPILRAAVIMIVMAAFTGHPAGAMDDPDEYLLKYMKAVREYRPAPPPKEEMYSKNDVIYCTGEQEVAKLNNTAAEMISFGEYDAAKSLLERGMKRAPLFFPYLYNIGLCCLHLRDYDRALIYTNKAKNLLPEFSRTYLQLGYIQQMKARNDEAIQQFRMALRVNLYELESLILIGDIYYNRNQVGMAEKYYRASLNMDPVYPNGLIGVAKIHFYRKEYAGTIITLKGVGLEGEYDKSLHYFWAESAYKLQDYQTAYDQYAALLTFKNDKFFITHARTLINHKLNLTAKFVGK
jgi:tetratricopeptide (TPR) repeat protein